MSAKFPIKPKYIIGIDTGVNTGVGVWDNENKKIIEVKTVPIHKALEFVTSYHNASLNGLGAIAVIVEDARMVRFKTSPEKSQGAGYVKAHAQIWEAFLKDKGIQYEMRRPDKSITKWDAERFKRQTGYLDTTTSHGRDAALLVYGS